MSKNLRQSWTRSLLLGLPLLAVACGGAQNPTDSLPDDEPPPSSKAPPSSTTAVQGEDVAAVQYAEAALISMKIGDEVVASCSGVLIAPRVVLTAGHCIEGFDGWKITLPYAQNQVSTTRRAATEYKSEGSVVNREAKDVGVLLLDEPLSLPSYPALQLAPMGDGTHAVNVGRTPSTGSPSATDLFVSGSHPLQDGVEIGYPFSYYTQSVLQPGDSGGPVFLADTSVHTIVAVNSGTGDGTEVMARLDVVSGWLTEQLNANP